MKKSSSKKKSSGPHKVVPGKFVPKVPVPRTLPPVIPPLKTMVSGEGTLQSIGREADEAVAIGKRILGMLNVENKETSVSTTALAVDYGGYFLQPLAGIAQGDQDNMRDGDSLKLKLWNGTLQFTRGGVDAIVAYAFVQEGPSFITAQQQVFEGAGTVLAPLSQPLWDARQAFKILKHGVHALTMSDPYWIVPFKHHYNHDVQFYNNTALVYEGRVSLVVFSNITGATSPTLNMDSQLSWLDN